MAFRVTDADVVRACTIGNCAVASRGSSHLSLRRKSKESVLQGNMLQTENVSNQINTADRLPCCGCQNLMFKKMTITTLKNVRES